MSGKSAAELEQEAEAARARMAETASTIRRKLTAGQMLDEVSGMVSGGDLSQGLGKLGAQVRDNPLPLTLIGAGIALLAFGPRLGGLGGDQHARSEGYDPAPRRSAGTSGRTAGRPHDPFAASADGHAGMAGGRRDGDGEGLGDRASRAAHDAADGVRSAAEGVRSAASSAAGTVRSAAHDASERVSDGASHLMETADRLGHEMLTGVARKGRAASSAASDALEKEPLAIGALGLLLGAVLGATLPTSEFEEEHLGPHARKLREGAEDLAERGLRGASAVASETVSKTYETVQEEADRRGLTPGDGETLASRVGEVAKAAVDTVDETVRAGVAPRAEGGPGR
jgi:hypothetical protein